jgi:hypothetical protein
LNLQFHHRFFSVSSWVFYRFHHGFFIGFIIVFFSPDFGPHFRPLFGPLFASFMEIDQKIEKLKKP